MYFDRSPEGWGNKSANYSHHHTNLRACGGSSAGCCGNMEDMQKTTNQANEG